MSSESDRTPNLDHLYDPVRQKTFDILWTQNGLKHPVGKYKQGDMVSIEGIQFRVCSVANEKTFDGSMNLLEECDLVYIEPVDEGDRT